MKARRTSEGVKLWQLAATAFSPSRSPWHRFCDDRLIGQYSLAILAVNFQQNVNELPLDNVWGLDTFPGGFLLAMPDQSTAESFPQGTDVETLGSKLGFSMEDPLNPLTTRESTEQSISQTEIPEWVASWNRYARQQALRYGTRIARNLPAPETALRYRGEMKVAPEPNLEVPE